ncbi:MAG: type II toxin-antitoxin system prevent-host-death family antitoxin [Bryobacterales bacterium]|nr:type II toxin-antitoxin system prevent-host-death family antitoxin [Bryobacterales bacterium]
MEANIVDLRYRMKDVLRAIDRGEVVTILYRGKRKAKLVPIAPAEKSATATLPRFEDQPAFGMWSDRADMADPDQYVRNMRQPRPLITTSPKVNRKSRRPR